MSSETLFFFTFFIFENKDLLNPVSIIVIWKEKLTLLKLLICIRLFLVVIEVYLYFCTFNDNFSFSLSVENEDRPCRLCKLFLANFDLF